jgi:hypothetical protein
MYITHVSFYPVGKNSTMLWSIRSKRDFCWRLCYHLKSRKQESNICQLVSHYFLFRSFAFSQRNSVVWVPATVISSTKWMEWLIATCWHYCWERPHARHSSDIIVLALVSKRFCSCNFILKHTAMNPLFLTRSTATVERCYDRMVVTTEKVLNRTARNM